MTTIDLYAVLGVARDASADEIREAWTASAAGLVPTDPGFRVLAQAGEVLLDERRRATYDAELAAAEEALLAEPAAEAVAEAAAESAVESAAGSAEPDAGEPDAEPTAEPAAPTSGQVAAATRGAAGAPSDLLLAVLAAAVVLTTLAAIFLAGLLGRVLPDRGAPDGVATAADAVRAAEDAGEDLLAYDYRTLDANKKASDAHLAPEFRKEFDRLWGIVELNAPANKSVVTAEVVASAVGRIGDDSVNVLLFVNRSTTSKASAEPSLTYDQVTLVMVRSGDSWRVEDLQYQRPA